MIKIKINVIDAICGAGKSSAAINMVLNSNDDERFIYVTPYLDEVERIKDTCKNKNFKEPDKHGTKLNGIKYLISKGENIVTTHALFDKFNKETIELAKFYGYTLIMDEVHDVVKILDISKNDLGNILDKHAIIEDDKLIWTDLSYVGKYEEYRDLCDIGGISVYGDGDNKVALLWIFPIAVFQAFKDIYVLTYMFDCQIQKYYYDLYNVEYNYLYVENYNITNKVVKYDTSKYKDLINVCDNKKINAIGLGEYALSKSWYINNNELIISLKNNCLNYFKNISKSPSNKNLWTTFKSHRTILSGKGYAKGFVSINMRATNKYKDRNSVAYLVNIFLNPVIHNFFTMKGVVVNEDSYALSELIQFLYRSAIRENNPINLYIPSIRMRNLLLEWLNVDIDENRVMKKNI